MGVYSTMEIKRKDAFRVLREAVAAHHGSSLITDEELEDMLFALFGDRVLHNFSIADEPNPERAYRDGSLRIDV